MARAGRSPNKHQLTLTTSEMKPPFPTIIDSTILATFKSCEMKAFRTYVEHWKRKGESIHLVAGAAYARGLEVARKAFWDGGDSQDVAVAKGVGALITAYGDFQPPEGASKTLDRMVGALEFYFSQCPFSREHRLGEQRDGKPYKYPHVNEHAIEFSFTTPLPVNHPQTGEPLIYSGRSDMIVEFADGIYIWDDKTTSSLGQSWASSWDLRSQFTGYCWAARELGLRVDGVVANGTSILKTKFDFLRAITYRSEFQINQWLDNTVLVLERFIRSWERDTYEYNFDDACTSFGGCSLKEICKSFEPDQWLPMYFEKRIWDPIARTETLID